MATQTPLFRFRLMLRTSVRRAVALRPARWLHSTPVARTPLPEYRTAAHYADAVRRKTGQGLFLAAGAGTAAALVTGPLLLLPTMAVGWGGGCYALWRLRPLLQQDPATITPEQGVTIDNTFVVLSVSSGLLLTPALLLLPAFTVPAAAGISACALVGLSHWNLTRSPSVSHWQDVVLAHAIGLATANLFNLGLFSMLGPNPVTDVLYNFNTDALVLLIAAVMANATQVSARIFQERPQTHTQLVVVHMVDDFLVWCRDRLDALKP